MRTAHKANTIWRVASAEIAGLIEFNHAVCICDWINDDLRMRYKDKKHHAWEQRWMGIRDIIQIDITHFELFWSLFSAVLVIDMKCHNICVRFHLYFAELEWKLSTDDGSWSYCHSTWLVCQKGAGTERIQTKTVHKFRTTQTNVVRVEWENKKELSAQFQRLPYVNRSNNLLITTYRQRCDREF